MIHPHLVAVDLSMSFLVNHRMAGEGHASQIPRIAGDWHTAACLHKPGAGNAGTYRMSLDQEALRTRLVDALHDVPGARELVEFGSGRDGKTDTFSDVDFQLLVDDCTIALPAFLTILGDVVSPEIEWTIANDPDHYWLMAIPNGMKPWFKVDIGLDPYNAGLPEDLGWTGKALWTQEAPTISFASINVPTWPRPVPGTIENFVLWNLVDLGRLAKFKHRGKPLNMLKFISQLARTTVIVEAMRSGQHDDLSDVPSTEIIAELDQLPIANVVDLNAPLADFICKLSYRLCDAVGDDDRLRRSCERMVMGSESVLRNLV
jgi:hypothetical protein